jgi:hypothetical protein
MCLPRTYTYLILRCLTNFKKSFLPSITTSSFAAESTSFSSKEVTSALTAVLVLVTESIRQSKGAEIKPFLTQSGFSSERADLLVKLQENIKSTTLVSLNSVQSPLPRVVDANWSLNYTDKVKQNWKPWP